MIVRALRTHEDSIAVDKEYVVLRLVLGLKGAEVLLITDEGGRDRATYPLADFEILDGRLSRTWVVTRYPHLPDLTFIGPAAWASDDFWTDFDGDWPGAMTFGDMADRSRIAMRAFDSAVADLYLEAGREWPNTPDAASDTTRP